MKNKIYAFIGCLLILICVLFAFASCDLGSEINGIEGAYINENGELILVYANGSLQNLGVVTGKDGTNGTNGIDGSVIITSDDGSTAMACAKGLKSAVSIVSNFQTTVQQGGWRPGSSSTTTKDYQSAGSGVIYKMDKAAGDAFIITNYHVVYDASSNTQNGISDDISIYLYGSEIEEKAIKATYVGGSLYYDVAILHIEDSEILMNSNAAEIDITDSDTLSVGDEAIAVGNAQGLGISASVGVISVDSEYITMTAADGKTSVSFRVMRVDTAVNSGNSGGGLYDNEGKLIGIVNAKIVDDGVENIGYAIPSNVAVSIADNIIDYCFESDNESVQRAMLGISVGSSDSKAAFDTETGKMKIEETVSVYEITSGSAADGILKEGDVLVRATLNGTVTEITRQYHIIDMMLDVRVGDTVTLTVIRDGDEMSVELTITEDCISEY